MTKEKITSMNRCMSQLYDIKGWENKYKANYN